MEWRGPGGPDGKGGCRLTLTSEELAKAYLDATTTFAEAAKALVAAAAKASAPAVPDAAAADAAADKANEERLRAVYREVSGYDIHYSTVRTAVSTFLVSVGLGLGSFFLGAKKSDLAISSVAAGFFAIALPAVIFFSP
jgi:hypothetical protein